MTAIPNKNFSLEEMDKQSLFHGNTSIADHLKNGPMLFPMQPLLKDRYLYEGYKEAWDGLRLRRDKYRRR